MQQGQKVLVPADGNAVLRDAAEPFEDALVERPIDLAPVANRPGRSGRRPDEILGQRLDLQTVDPDDAKAFVDEIVLRGARGAVQQRRVKLQVIHVTIEHLRQFERRE